MIWRVAVLALGLLLALTLIPAVRHLREVPPPPPPAVRLTLEPPDGAEFGSGGLPFDLAVAPTGREIAFVATTGGESQLWRRPLDALRAEPVAGTAGATLPAYAPDGTFVWYFAGNRLHALNLTTGERRDVIEARAALGVAVGARGAILLASGGPIQGVAGRTASPVTTLRPGERSHAFPAWTGTRDAFVYLATREDGQRSVRLHDADRDVELTRTDSHGIVAAGHLLFVRDGLLRAAPLEIDAGRLGARAHTLAFDVGVSLDGRGAFAVGGHVLASGPPSSDAYVLQWFDNTGQALDTISEPADYWQLRLSPDERTVAVTMRDALLGTLDVFTIPASGGPSTRVTLALAADTDPVWSADRRRIAFRSAQEGQPHIYARAVAPASTADEPLWRSPFDEFPTDWSPAALIFHARTEASGFDIWALAPGAASPRPLARTGFNEIDGRLSPDRRWLAYASDEGGQFDIYISSLADPPRRTRVTTAGGTRPRWADDGRALVFTRGAEILRVRLTPAGNELRPSTPMRVLHLPGVRDVAPSRDGRRLLVLAPRRSVQTARVAVAVGWAALLESR